MRMQRIRALGLLLLLGAMGACGGPEGPNVGGRVAISFGTGASGAAKASVSPIASGADTIILGPDTLVVDTAELVLKHIEFETQGDTIGCEEGEGEHEDCNELEVGPLLVELPLGGGVAHQFSVDVPPGTYAGLEFKIHTPGRDADDSTFVAAHPDLRRVSIRLAGTFDRRSFTYTSHVSAKQEQEFATPVQVGSGTPLDVTILVDLSQWFVNESRTQLVDPATAAQGQPNERLVNRNIRRSFRAFRDHDHDGHEDH